MANELKGHLGILVGPNVKGLTQYYVKQFVDLGIDKLMITKTSQGSIDRFKKHLETNAENFGLIQREIPIDYHIVRSPRDLDMALELTKIGDDEIADYFKERKVFSVVAGKAQGREGDNIHPGYVESLMRRQSGYILCEKPFSASQKPEHFEVLENLGSHSSVFGLNLQMSYVMNILAQAGINDQINKVGWSSAGNPDTIVKDLLPHIFSLLENNLDVRLMLDSELSREELEVKEAKMKNGINSFHLARTYGNRLEINIDANNSGVRGFECGGDTYLMGPNNSIEKYTQIPLNMVHLRDKPSIILGGGDDFLKQSILDVKAGNPICGLERTIACEKFLSLFQ